MSTTNLWPDFRETGLPRSPKTVVEQAGSGLKQKTNGLVLFVQTTTSIKGGQVEVTFDLLVPALLYKFPFLLIRFGVDSMYPVSVIAGRLDEGVAYDENELTALLGKIFNDPSTIGTIERLMSLVK